jgi:hypothetical protein
MHKGVGMKRALGAQGKRHPLRTQAEELAGLLGADTERIVEKTNQSGFLGFLSTGADSSMGKLGDIEALSRDPSAFDLVIFCTPVWAWHVSPPVHAFVVAASDQED